MKPERWEAVERLYNAALELEPDRREAFLNESCASDESLRKEVVSLLACQPEAEGLLESPALEAAAKELAQDAKVTPPAEMTGRTIAHYRVLEKIGAGGMGVVYKARDLSLRRFVALKVLPPEHVADPDRRRRFVQEARAASALNHPHIVTIHDITREGGADLIVMEYVEGKTLDQRIGHRGLGVNDVLKYAAQIADALAKAHSAGIVHRDLKPTNIMVNEDGAVKVLDFGLAKLTEQIQGDETSSRVTVDSEGRPITEEGLIVGTVTYMSPEQAEGKKVDARSDIFSLGTVLYEMVTGQRAFQGTSRMSTFSAILHEEPKPASQIARGVPPDLDKLISRCLRKDPAKRFQHMDDVKVALDELKEESDSGRLQATAAKAKPPHRLIWAFGILAALAITGAGIWFVRFRVGTQEIPLTTVPLTSYPGFERGASFSPDGNQVAFDWNGEKEDNEDIYVKWIGSNHYLRLTSNPADDRWPAWSPDGSQIAFCRFLKGGTYAVVLISPLGGPERILTQSFCLASNVGPFLSWSPDGRALAMVEQANQNSPRKLVLYMMETGERRPLTAASEVDPEDSCPAFSPDGRTLAFCRWFAWDRTDLFLLELSQDFKPIGPPRSLTLAGNDGVVGALEGSYATNPAWIGDGTALVYAKGGNLWRIAASGSSKPQRLAMSGEGVYNPVISRQGSRLVFCKSISDFDIWRIKIPSQKGKANPPTKFISSTRYEGAPHYSPDGKKIAFASDRSGTLELWVCDADGTNPIQLTHIGKGFYYLSRWSPDSTRLTFGVDIDGYGEVYVMDANGGTPRRLTIPGAANNPSWSHDGHWIYFNSSKSQVSVDDIQKIPPEGGTAVLVNSDPVGWGPLESPDGKFVYALRVDAEGCRLVRTSVEGGKVEQVLDSMLYPVSCSIADNGIYFVPRRDPAGGYSICFLELATRKTTVVAELGKKLAWNLDVSPDRRWALYDQDDQSGSDLMLVENFR